ncbi:hypothetical protein P3T43_001267 [Paraburkholderia sp. GAS41]|jgi:hypothetical protein
MPWNRVIQTLSRRFSGSVASFPLIRQSLFLEQAFNLSPEIAS